MSNKGGSKPVRLLPLAFDASPAPNGEMLSLARESRGLSQTELAKAMGIAQGTLSKMESGLMLMTDEVVAQAAELLHYPTSFFLQPGSRIGVGAAEIFHRKRADAPIRVLNRLYAQIDILIRNVARLMQSAEIPLRLKPMAVEDYGEPEKIAQLIRASWELPRGPIKDMTATLEEAGIVVVPMDMGTTKIDAMARWVPNLPPVIFINADAPKDRLRFSLAHELGHLLMHAMPDPDMERQADQFAAELLCPARDIREDLLDLTLDRLPNLKRYWRVSMSMLVYRAREIRAITESRARYLWQQLSKLGYSKKEPVELLPKGENPDLLFELVEHHLDYLKLSREEIARMLHVTMEDLRKRFEPPTSPSTLRVVS